MTTPKTIDLYAVGSDAGLLAQAIEVLPGKENVSPSKVQRWLHVGFAKAGHLVNLLETNGLIGPYRSSRAGHEILVAAGDAPKVAADLRERATNLGRAERRSADQRRRRDRLFTAAGKVTCDDLHTVVTSARFSASMAQLGHTITRPLDLHTMTFTPVKLYNLALDLATDHDFYLTTDMAGAVPLPGHNLRCNRCGSWGADWTEDVHARPDWGRLALCPADTQEWHNEHQRHTDVLRSFRDGRRVNFEQPTPKAVNR